MTAREMPAEGRCFHCSEDFHGDCLGSSQFMFGTPICACDCPDARAARKRAAAHRAPRGAS